MGTKNGKKNRRLKVNNRFRIISKEGTKWKAQHSDGQTTYHKTKKAAKEYEHTLLVFDPFFEDVENDAT